MKRPSPELARRLVDATEEVLRPDRELRIEDVAAMVGSARATLYYYFSGRDDLVMFLLEEHLDVAAEQIHNAIPSGESPTGQLRLAVAAIVKFLSEHIGVCAALLSFAGATGRVADLMAAKDAKLATPLRRILDEGASAGQFVIGDSRDAANAMLGAAMTVTLSRSHDGGDTAAPEYQQALTDQLVRGVMPG